MDLSIICVNWNSVDYLRECIASIYENTHEVSFEIIVVDNASPKGGVETLQEQFPEIVIIKSAHNLGFAGANNLGFKRSAGEYILFLNPDTRLIGPTIDTLMNQIRLLPDAGILGCKMLNTDLSVQITSIQKLPTILNQVLNSEYLQLRWPGCPIWSLAPLFSKQTKPIRVQVIPGACMLMTRKVFEQVGMFSEEYFMYGEDLDLNYKLNRAGYSNYYTDDATIIHHGGRSSSQQKVNHWATVMKYRAMTRYFKKNHGWFYEAMFRAAMACIALVRLTILALMYPLGNIIWDKQSRQFASEKWKVILKWAFGFQGLALGQ
jgi:GT2 family glycosyltransferase